MKPPVPVQSLLERLALTPPEQDIAIVLRHAEREPIPPGGFGTDVALTANGVAAAELLGGRLAHREPGAVYSSPLLRCRATAAAIIRGAGWEAAPESDWRLGWPGPFVIDEELSGPLFMQLGSKEVVRRQLTDQLPPAGMRATEEGLRLFLELARPVSAPSPPGRLSLLVTHDSVLAVIVGRLYALGLDGFPWPDYLDGLLLWHSGGTLLCSWRELGLLEQAAHPPGG